MNKIFRNAMICSLTVALYGISFHYYNNNPHDWKAVLMWLPIYISPIWGIATASFLSERGKK
jgi:hypothetical protein